MAATIKIKNSSTTGSVPSASNLVQGELAVNVTDLGLYTENASGTVVKLNAPSIDDKNTGATKHLTIDTSGNLGLGVTPSAWRNLFNVVQSGQSSAFVGQTNSNTTYVASNWYSTSGGTDTRIAAGYASQYYQDSGQHVWRTAGTSTAGSSISFTQAMTLDASGNLLVGATSSASIVALAQQVGNGTASSGFQTYSGASSYSGLYFGTALTGAGRTAGYVEYNHATSTLIFGASGGEKARIDSSGNLLVGTTTAGAGIGFSTRLAVDGGASEASIFKTSAGASAYCSRMWNSATSGNNLFINFQTEAGGTDRGSISYNRGGGLVAYNTTSDYRAKTITGLVQNALSKLASLKPSTGRMNGAEFDIDFFVAHELQEVVPSAVTGEKDAVKEDGTPEYQMVDKSALIPLLTAAIQEQQALITSQSELITALTARIEALEQ